MSFNVCPIALNYEPESVKSNQEAKYLGLFFGLNFGIKIKYVKIRVFHTNKNFKNVKNAYLSSEI